MKGQLVSTEIAEPYAQALMSIAEGHGLVDRFGDEIRNLLEIMAESPELESFIANPVIEEPQKKAVINEIVGRDFHPYLVNFLMLLVDKRRLVFLKEVCQQYLAQLRQLKNIILAEVTSATDVNDDQRRAIADKVKTLTGANEVELAVSVNSELIGGVIIKVGSQVFDTSLKGQLRRIGLSLGRGA